MRGFQGDKRNTSPRLVTGIFVMICAVMAVSAFTFWRVDRLERNVDATTRLYVPILKRLNLLSGKWSAYEHAFEQYVGFRDWGTALSVGRRVPPRLPLRRMIEGDLDGISNILDTVPASTDMPSREALRGLVDQFTRLSDAEAGRLALIVSMVKLKQYSKAAAVYNDLRQTHERASNRLRALNMRVQGRITAMQLEAERELHESQSMMLLVLISSLIVSLVVLSRLRRWFLPVFEWTRVAREIAQKGSHRDVKFPRITRTMPPEISLLTREFTRMGMTILERERTIEHQKDKLSSLNEHLKEQNSMLRKLGGLNERILNSMSSGLLVIGSDGAVEQFNQRYCELFNSDRSNILGAQASQVLSKWPEDQVARWLATSESVNRLRTRLEGRVFDVSVGQLHAVAGRLLLFEDVTQVVKAEERLEHAKKLVLAGNLSAQVAHEVRNPLNSMSLQLEMLEEDVETMPDASLKKNARKRIDAVEEQVQRLDRITRRYLDMRPKSVTRRISVDLHALIERCLGFLAAEIQVARVRVELHLDAPRPFVSGDEDALSEVIFNLARNAVEAMARCEGPRILRVSTQQDEPSGSVSVNIEDTGPGLSAGVRERLFEPFVTDKAEGHGLGLSVSRQICIAHGGELRWAAGHRDGSCFEFSVPSVEKT